MSTTQPQHRRPGGTLYRYLAREMIFPTLFALGGLTTVLLTNDLLEFSDLVINRGFGLGAVALVAFYKTVPVISQTLPFAVMVGSFVALGRLGADRELLVLEASGVSAPRLIGPMVSFALVAALVGFALSLHGAPRANRALHAALEDFSRERPSAALTAGKTHHFGEWKLEAREVSAGGEAMRGVLLWMPEIGETVFAEAGELSPDGDGRTRVTLENGTLLLNPRERVRELRFESMTTLLPSDAVTLSPDESERLGADSLEELLASWRSGEIAAGTELHRRFALPAATLIFGLLVVPLFFARAHFSRSGGGVLGIVATVAYYGLVQLGDGLVQSGDLSVAAGVWLPNLVLGAIALALVVRLRGMSSFGRHVQRPRARGGEAVSARSPGRIRTRRWALSRYISSRFVQMAVICFSVLMVAYLLVDVLERLQSFARYQAEILPVLRYYAARLPVFASRVFPMALLVATALTVSLLAAQGELVGMRSCGLPAPRALLPVLAICAFVVPLYFLLNDEVVPRTNRLAEYIRDSQIKHRLPGRRTHSEVWFRVGDHLYEAESLDTRAGTARNITVYELEPNGLPVSRADARAGRHIGGGVWRLEDPVRIEVSSEGVRQAPAGPFAELGEALPAEVDTRLFSVEQLRDQIAEVERSGHDATVYRVDLFVKLAAPVACLVLPALALFFAISGPPYPSAAATLVMSVIVSVSYVLLTGVSTSLGYGKALSPVLAGLAPAGLFGLLALYFGLRLRGFGQTF